MTARMFRVPDRHAGRVYLATGGADGIGRACAEADYISGTAVIMDGAYLSIG